MTSAFVPQLDSPILDRLAFFRSVRRLEEHNRFPCFLFEKSMCRAICLLNHLRVPPKEWPDTWWRPCAGSPTRSTHHGHYRKSSSSSCGSC
ncbi:hypothetical protein EE612_005355 [Oryza sativa]|nr:hypothetical protein EE612_005355 [Oryza sativa]